MLPFTGKSLPAALNDLHDCGICAIIYTCQEGKTQRQRETKGGKMKVEIKITLRDGTIIIIRKVI